jgi:hypothetical protein
VIADDWTPTAENINALPPRLQEFIHWLSARADPAGDTATILCQRQDIDGLVKKVREREGQLRRVLSLIQRTGWFLLRYERRWVGELRASLPETEET